jgi:hypothetical protein
LIEELLTGCGAALSMEYERQQVQNMNESAYEEQCTVIDQLIEVYLRAIILNREPRLHQRSPFTAFNEVFLEPQQSFIHTA